MSQAVIKIARNPRGGFAAWFEPDRFEGLVAIGTTPQRALESLLHNGCMRYLEKALPLNTDEPPEGQESAS